MPPFLRPSPGLLALFLLTQVLAPSTDAEAARVGIFTEQDRANERAAQIGAAIETGDAARLTQLVAGYFEPVPIIDHVKLNPAIARAYLLLGQPERALPFALDSYARSRDPEVAWLAAELLYATDDFTLGDKIAGELRSHAPHHPALPYLQARRGLCQLILGDADTDWAGVRSEHAAARQAADLAAVLTTDQVAGQDPRFLTAGLDLALLDFDYPRAAGFAARLSTLRPRNPGLARLALACAFPVEARRRETLQQLAAQKTLPPDELAMWSDLATRLGSETDAARGWISLAETTARRPVFIAARLVFLERALASEIETASNLDSPTILGLLDAYGDAAREARSFPHAARAVSLRDELRRRRADFPMLAENENSVRLLDLSARHLRAAAMVIALLPASQNDFEWLARNRRVAARHPEPLAYLAYLSAMEALRPEDPRTLLELARALDKVTEPRALTLYRRVFARCPADIRPKVTDWFSFANLLQAAVARGDIRLAEAALEFDAMTERAYRTDNLYAVAAHFYADLLRRQAAASNSAEAWQRADAARAHALRLDPFADDFFQKLGRPGTLSIR